MEKMDLIAFNCLLYLTGQQVVDDLQMLKLAFLGAVPAAEADPLHGFADEANLLGNLRHKFIVVKANNKLVQEHIQIHMFLEGGPMVQGVLHPLPQGDKFLAGFLIQLDADELLHPVAYPPFYVIFFQNRISSRSLMYLGVNTLT